MKIWTRVALVAVALAMAGGCNKGEPAKPEAPKKAATAGEKAAEAGAEAAKAAGEAAEAGAEAAVAAGEAAVAAGAAGAAAGAEAAKAAGEAAVAAGAAGAAAGAEAANAAEEAAKSALEAAKAAGAEGAAAGAEAVAQAAAAAGAAAAAVGSIESTDILGRDAVTQKAEVKHVLIGWKDLAAAYRGQMDPRAAARTREQADALATEILGKVRAGEDIDALMKASSEDPGSAQTGRPYTATEDAPLVPPFKKLSLRLNVDEAGLVQTAYGWHVIKRIQ